MNPPVNFLEAIVLGIVQGATEFLPISSSGHLVLVPWLLNWPAPGLLFSTMVHWGTLVAVVAYFHDDLLALLQAWLASVRERSLNPGSSTDACADPQRRLAWLILIGGVPAGLAGLFFENFFETLFGRPAWAATFLLVTGLFLVFSERWQRRHHSLPDGAIAPSTSGEANPSARIRSAASLSLVGALFIGLAQALAIAPGISRSGATIAAGLLVGLDRRESARFSFLLATPVIFGAGALQLLDLVNSSAASARAPTLILGFIVAGVTGYLAIRFLLNYLQHHALDVFAVYCWGVGVLGLVVNWLR